MRELVATIIVVLSVAAASAQTASDFEPVLLPLALRPAQSTPYGSLWITELALRNNGSERVRFLPLVCGGIECPDILLEPHGTVLNPPIAYKDPQSAAPPGRLVYVERAFATDIVGSLVLRDLSQTGQWGTELPLVRESSFRSSPIEILNVPSDSLYRQTLRIYDIDAHPTIAFTVRVYDLSSDALLAEQQVATTGAFAADVPLIPGYAQIDRLTEHYGITGDKRLRVEVAPQAPTRFWAFVSVTSNTTQHVTIFTPQ